MKNKTLAIWFKDGSTAYFEQVADFIDEWQTNSIRFAYFGVRSQVERRACFNLNSIAGYAIEID